MLKLDTNFVVGRSNMKRGGSFLFLLLIVFSLQFVRGDVSQSVASDIKDEGYLQTLDRLQEYPKLDTTKLPYIYAGSYLLLDGETGEYIIGKNFDQQVAVASTTKMTTALLARSLYQLGDVLTVKSGPYVTGSKADLYVGEKITVENLLKGLLIQSGNDAAITLAEGLSTESGDTAAFVTKMNEYLTAHNINNTKFVDPAGLEDTGVSTAFDLAQVGRLLLNDSVLAEIVRTAGTTISSVDGKYTHELKNSNRLLLSDSEYYLPGTLGIKTGFTYAAGHCLVSAYTIDNHPVVGVVLNTTESTITASAQESYKLYKWAEQHLSYVKY